ncbi:MAG: hypothetical protein A2172_00730 [Candidatus Woykebacteria bacterium RBG_13_40_15]|uniref:Phosphoribosyltransferase domain-containing protein n=1 Tax=Candidatus Woykebacteria bacterium RBG_13_40_15 TaxID=1802593 RepID=A0A1G1W8Q7_9BACT|nr:MAG: hypothetical protein A2172_00730 [Candidatus Woykebacteria bacterium RBG_13_40_15]
MGLLDLIFPKRCVVCSSLGTYLCENDRLKIKPTEQFCPVCLKAAIGGTTHPKCKTRYSLDGLVCLFQYSSPIKDLIGQLKYRFTTDLETTIIEETKKSKNLANHNFKQYFLVPIPVSSNKKRWRGFNQTEILGRKIASLLGIDFDPNILIKTKQTKPQATLPKKERLIEVTNSFDITKEAEVRSKNYLVFDDVWTTGATVREVTKVLKRKGAGNIWALILASSHKNYLSR